MPITVMGLAVRQHLLQTFPPGWRRTWGAAGAGLCAVLGGVVFVSQIIGKWSESGWLVLISFSVLVLSAHALLISPIGYRTPAQIYRIVRTKARIQGGMASIVEWQSAKMQEYRYALLIAMSRFWELFGIRRPIRFEPPPAGDYAEAMHVDGPGAPATLPLAAQAINRGDKFTLYSLVIVGVFFTISLQLYLADTQAGPLVRTLAILIPGGLLATYAVWASRQTRRPKR
jgi:hypothetical protein